MRVKLVIIVLNPPIYFLLSLFKRVKLFQPEDFFFDGSDHSFGFCIAFGIVVGCENLFDIQARHVFDKFHRGWLRAVLVDLHWFRGKSYLKIGWAWVKRSLCRGETFQTGLALSPKPDPEPAMASRKQHQKRSQPRFLLDMAKAA